jgi:sulfatase maturation enzyme AslB (radical SAM superfamily)
MSADTYCPMIHGGLHLNLKESAKQLVFNQCCLSTAPLTVVNDPTDVWSNKTLSDMRQRNDDNTWDKNCWECQRAEASGSSSFRLDMINKFGIKRNLSGPQRIDLLFDRSCNLACRTCGPHNSTLWQQHLKQNNIPIEKYANTTKFEEIISMLRSIDLSNLEMVQFCGGETLMGNTYWNTANAIAELVTDAKHKITLGFQTNGTQKIDERNFEILEKFHLVKILISLDGIGDRFDYMRWPANWNQVSDNIMAMKEQLPVNVMFIIQETTSNLNLFYHNEVSDWVNANFSTNRLGDITNYANQLSMHDNLNVNNITQEYYDAISSSNIINLLPPTWHEDPQAIKLMIQEVEMFDKFRNQNWQTTFPEVAEFYSRYI